MICVSITEITYEDCYKAVKKCEKLFKEDPSIVAEIRLDLCDMTQAQVRKLFMDAKIPLIAICRKSTIPVIETALESGAKFIDIDAIYSDSFYRTLAPILRRRNIKKLFSYRNFNETPDIEELVKIYKRSVKNGADVVKIAATANTIEDAERIISLYRLQRDGELGDNVPLIAFAMGKRGTYTRLEALNLGAPMMYCSLREEKRFSVGQLPFKKMMDLYSGYSARGEVKIPTSKSVAQRAIISAALSSGESFFRNFSSCRDIDSALGVAKQVGASVNIDGNSLTIIGKGFDFIKKKAKSSPTSLISAIVPTDTLNLFVGESGLLSRICIPIAAQLGEGVNITGEGSLMAREMYGCKETLEQFGAKCILTALNTLPAIVSGPLKGGNFTVSGRSGSQLISGLLMSLPLCKKDSTLTVTNPTSIPYIDLTLETLDFFGIKIDKSVSEAKIVFTIPGKQHYSPVDMTLEGDWSSASNFFVIGALFGDLLIKGLNINSLQADKAILSVVKNCGADIILEKNGIRVRRSHLIPFEYDATNSPDLFPSLAIMASLIEGESVITGIDRLRNKESNRTDAIFTNLSNMGVSVSLNADSMIINGISPARRVVESRLLKGGSYSSYNDHRIAMMLKIASLCCDGKVVIDQVECIEKSFPLFNELFNSIITLKKK